MSNGWIVGSDDNISERRFKILYELLLALPNSHTVLASNDPKTSALFQKWTGFTQETLESAWISEGFVKDEKGHWKRAGGGAVTTSCEGLVMSVFGLIERYNMGRRKGLATAFNLANVDRQSGKERTDPVGWHWFRDYYDVPDSPQPGDLFQVGVLMDYKQWTLQTCRHDRALGGYRQRHQVGDGGGRPGRPRLGLRFDEPKGPPPALHKQPERAQALAHGLAEYRRAFRVIRPPPPPA